jgi:hypothetical protein
MPAASVEYFAEDGIAFAPIAVTGKNIGPVAAIFPVHSHFSLFPTACRFALL